MNIALCYESVLPARGGAETYIGDLSRRLDADGHEVHLYACRWEASALPKAMVFHQLPAITGPRFLRPWTFGKAVEAAISRNKHDVTVGFDKTWGQDVLYPQGGLHAASQRHNRRKERTALRRFIATGLKYFDLAFHSFRKLEQKQYCSSLGSTVIVNSAMVQRHFAQYLPQAPAPARVIHSAIDPMRFVQPDREAIRAAERQSWNVSADEPVGLFVGMNYRLKGLEPLIRSLVHLPKDLQFSLVVVGHPKFGKYQRLADDLGVAGRIRFLGHRNDPKSAYHAADFLIHPTFYDPCSLVALEALACGLPVLTTQYNGASELLDIPANGLVIDDPHDGSALAKAIGRMSDRGYLESARPAALAAAQRWTFEMHYAALLDVFREVANGKDYAALKTQN
jgi:UDP-glucose:(heptosyl)LPS alpha-1,3-glucosyltransferase